MHKTHSDVLSARGTILVEEALIIRREEFSEGQISLEITAPRIALAAQPGSFLHIRCDPQLPMRRPISLMGADPVSGHVKMLFRSVGHGTRLLAERKVGEKLDVIGPIGNPFRISRDRPRALLLGGGLGMPPVIFLANRLAKSGSHGHLLLLGSEIAFPFTIVPSHIPVSLPEGIDAAMSEMEDVGVASRLASGKGHPGAFRGRVTEIARNWLDRQSTETHQQIAVYACGPEPMLRATSALAREYDLPCQVSLEEYMACGIGACAGCAVPVTTPAGAAMKRVCVDGPVFDADVVFVDK